MAIHDAKIDPQAGDEITRLSWVHTVVARPRYDRVLYVSRLGSMRLNSTVACSLAEWRELAEKCEVLETYVNADARTITDARSNSSSTV